LHYSNTMHRREYFHFHKQHSSSLFTRQFRLWQPFRLIFQFFWLISGIFINSSACYVRCVRIVICIVALERRRCSVGPSREPTTNDDWKSEVVQGELKESRCSRGIVVFRTSPTTAAFHRIYHWIKWYRLYAQTDRFSHKMRKYASVVPFLVKKIKVLVFTREIL